MLFVFSAPSGSGKTTLINHLMSQVQGLTFSVSATSRPPRGEERDGVEYHFLSEEEFRRKIEEDAFVEYEEVYAGTFYGTLKSEIDGRLAKGENVVLDVDVKGGLSVKRIYGDKALLIFIQPPSIEELRRRLEKRGTDTPEKIQQRVDKAAYELTFAPQFDVVITNDDLDTAEKEVVKVVSERVKHTPSTLKKIWRWVVDLFDLFA
ncbi:MAG: guanylate kinase [Bacteroidaceae bacterium]|nr:guanylate kinase [Bacteroidaceae bacterium]